MPEEITPLICFQPKRNLYSCFSPDYISPLKIDLGSEGKQIDEGRVATYDENMKQGSMKDGVRMADRGIQDTKSKTRKMADEPLVISASRRTDLVGCYPEALLERLQEFPSGTCAFSGRMDEESKEYDC